MDAAFTRNKRAALHKANLRLEAAKQVWRLALEPEAIAHRACARGTRRFEIVVTGHAQGASGTDHGHDQAQYGGGIRAAIDRIAQKACVPSLWMSRHRGGRVAVHEVTEFD